MRRIEAFRGDTLEILDDNIKYYRDRLPEAVPISVSLTVAHNGIREALVIFEVPDRYET